MKGFLIRAIGLGLLFLLALWVTGCTTTNVFMPSHYMAPKPDPEIGKGYTLVKTPVFVHNNDAYFILYRYHYVPDVR